VEKIEDPTLPIGTVEVEEKGAQGSSHITYKIIKENGTSKTEVLTRSTYQATDRVERVGTKEVEEVVAEQDGEVTQETDTTLDEASTETNNSEETSAEKPEITDGGTIE
ncbi:MAG: G5 domain-containing protein, partial [Clostridia bacterium]|nr:G5 domain-containing protein [Clostridia bacterium]